MVEEINKVKELINNRFKNFFPVEKLWRPYDHSDEYCRSKINKYANLILNYYFTVDIPNKNNENISVIHRNLLALSMRRSVDETRKLEMEFLEYYDNDRDFRSHYISIINTLS